MGSFSLIHWIILGIVVLLLFGGNRFSAMMGDVAKGLKSFKQGMSEDDTPPGQDHARRAEPPRQLPPQAPIDITSQPRPDAPPASPPPPPSDDSAR
jgi:sec-independent protein translocase protein TatA